MRNTLSKSKLKHGTLRVHDLELALLNRRAVRGGRPLILTGREFDLLYLLALKRGQIVTRSEIIDHLYADDPEGAARSNVVDVYIHGLRRKVDNGFWPRLILTRRGRGYMLRA